MKNFYLKISVEARRFIMMIFGMTLLMASNGCQKQNDLDERNEENPKAITRSAPGFHWTCPNQDCRFYNGGWLNNCSYCGTEYEEHLSDLTTCMFRIVQNTVKFTTEIGGMYPGDSNRLQLRGNIFPAYEPEAWYDSAGAKKFYEEIKKSSAYRLTPGYAEAADYAWFRTTRILYPGVHRKNDVEKEYTRFMLENGKYLKDFKGQGIKDASKAAINAFCAY